MEYLRNLWVKFAYSHYFRLFFDGLARVGLQIMPLYMFQENISPETMPALPDDLKEYEVSFWGPQEIKKMALIQTRSFSEKELLKRLQKGQMCLGLKKDNNLAGFSWCDLKEFSFKWYRWPLKENEAYLFDAYTSLDYRGQGIAPFLRYSLYKELEKLGRNKIYSYSDYFNTPAVNFKKKLNAKIISLMIFIVLFRKWHFHFSLKNYNDER